MERNDSELHEVLREWKAPETPASLASRVLRDHRAWWEVLVRGYIRVPVPVACVLVMLMIAGAWRIATGGSSTVCPATASVTGAAVVQDVTHEPVHPATCAWDADC